MASSLRERRKALLRDEILAATHQLMAERGYAAMSMEELAARVGVSKPTLYSQFPTKDDLVAAMALQLMGRIFAQTEGEGDASPLQRLLRFLHTSVRLQVLHRTSAMQLWMPEILAILERHPESRAYLRQVEERLVATLRDAIAAGEIAPDLDIPSVVRVYNALNISPSIGCFTLSGDPDPDRLADMVVEIFRRGLAAQGDAT
ncbi:MAG TPA: TetR/AcrR family transcriptional regulator [Chloroflexaceae bacterium]|nr:TetR/AcrR family transcriptional regulator [Chloroflexaceae bacterium]